MKKISWGFIVCMLLIGSNQSTYAWGKKGHELVAEVAFHYLDAATKKNVLDYLNGTTIEEAATWMDDKRKDPSYDYMKPYHYVNFEAGAPVTEPDGDNIIKRLNTTLRELDHKQNMSKEDIKIRLFYLFHLVGDLHQPLHEGYGADKGGNTYQVSFFGKGTNLHAVWDTEMIEYKNLTLDACLNSTHYNAKEIATIQKINVIAWATEGRSYLPQVYNLPDHQMTAAYVDTNMPLVQSQILKAGLRLAAILDYYFKG